MSNNNPCFYVRDYLPLWFYKRQITGSCPELPGLPGGRCEDLAWISAEACSGYGSPWLEGKEAPPLDESKCQIAPGGYAVKCFFCEKPVNPDGSYVQVTSESVADGRLEEMRIRTVHMKCAKAIDEAAVLPEGLRRKLEE
jgi:hypothetical protein